MTSDILVVEDDPTIGSALQRLLVSGGYEARWSATGAEAMSAVEAHLPDLVLLDAGLPDVDGFTLCRALRAKHASLPIVMVTARDSDIDIVVGLDAGANDYVTKPFSTPVLLARMRAHLRSAAPADAVQQFGELRIDPGAHRVFLGEAEVELRPKEFELLVMLTSDAGKVVTRDRLLSEIWDLHWENSTKTLDMHVHALRRKLGDDVESPRWISTVRGIGYRFELQ